MKKEDPGVVRGRMFEQVRATKAYTSSVSNPDTVDKIELAAFMAIFHPPTMKVTSPEMPQVRKTVCEKCPFGDGLAPNEQLQANALKARLAGEPQTLWGCHEASHKGAALICAGFAAWRENRNA